MVPKKCNGWVLQYWNRSYHICGYLKTLTHTPSHSESIVQQSCRHQEVGSHHLWNRQHVGMKDQKTVNNFSFVPASQSGAASRSSRISFPKNNSWIAWCLLQNSASDWSPLQARRRAGCQGQLVWMDWDDFRLCSQKSTSPHLQVCNSLTALIAFMLYFQFKKWWEAILYHTQNGPTDQPSMGFHPFPPSLPSPRLCCQRPQHQEGLGQWLALEPSHSSAATWLWRTGAGRENWQKRTSFPICFFPCKEGVAVKFSSTKYGM